MEYGKSFVHNGLKYQRSEDTVLFTLRNKNNRYIGIDLGREGNEFIINKTVLTTSDEAFIFMMDKEIFEEKGITNTITMLREEASTKMNYAGFKPVMV